MNIKQAEHLSGVSKRNIRFYEQQGLLTPTRNKENDYREYTDSDIETLKQIRILRMVDMPLDQIKSVLEGHTRLSDAAATQRSQLESKICELEAAIRFCQEFSTLGDLHELDPDTILQRMDAPKNRKGLFVDWINDYRKVALAEHNRVFTFTPDTLITTPGEFTLALCEYANQYDLNLIITREGMCPEFTLDGIEYTAERFYTNMYRFPVTVVRCTAKHPENFAADVDSSRKPLLTLLYRYWFVVPLSLLMVVLLWDSLMTSWEGWVILFSLLGLFGASIFRSYYFYYNYNGKPKKK